MSRVALAASKGEDLPPRFVSFDSKVSAAKGGWEAVLGMKDIPVMKSRKTCVITDQNDEKIFMLYKVSESWFGMRCRYPVTPFVGFGLAVAIISCTK
jgi:hypothetical protein